MDAVVPWARLVSRLTTKPRKGRPQMRSRKGRHCTCAGRPEVLSGQSRQGSFVQRFLRGV